MKTVSMPLEEYEREIKEAKAQGQMAGYQEGALAMAKLIKLNVSGTDQNAHFRSNDELNKVKDEIVKECKGTKYALNVQTRG